MNENQFEKSMQTIKNYIDANKGSGDSTTSISWNNVTDKPTIPSRVSELTNDSDFVTKKYVDDNLPYYNETLMFEISDATDYTSFYFDSYFNTDALNLDETKVYIAEEGFIDDGEKYTYEFVYDKENDALICEDGSVYIYNHKSYDGTDFIEDENSAVLTYDIKIMDLGGEVNGYFKLYEVDGVKLDNGCLPNDISIKNSLTVGTRMGDIGTYSVVEGENNTASAYASHAEGLSTTASNTASHAEGDSTTASGRYSHAEGYFTIASGEASHAEGYFTIASGEASHAEGYFTIASGEASHAEGGGTIASSECQHVQGKFNIEDTTNTYAHIVGNGETDDARSNAHTLDWNGNAWFAGNVSVDGTPTYDNDLTTKKYVDNKVADLVDSAPKTLDTLKELATALGNDANFATTVSNQIGNKVDKVEGKGLSTNDLTNELKTNYDTAYTHSQSTHAPSNAQKNSDITKAEIEAKLIGNITTHTHSQYLTEHQSLEAYALKTDLHSHSNKATLDGISSTNVSNWNSAYTHSQSAHFSGNYNDLTNKPTIPTIPNSLPANGGNADTVNGFSIWSGTQAEYDAISSKDANTIYLIKEG